MKYQTIHIEGAILSADILDKIEQNTIKGQNPADFATNNNVKDDIAAAWADAQSYWSIYQRRIERLNINQSGVTETRNHWMVPLLGLLGYSLEVQQKGEIVNNKNYTISHRDSTLNKNPDVDNNERDLGLPVHVMGCNDELDRKRQDSGPRMSPHGLLQEYLNLTEHLYGIVSNGLRLRLLRDSSRLIKLSYIEFDLEQMMQENHYADFAIMYRLLHASRMPADMDSASESLIELFHQESLDSGSRIRDGLSTAVEDSILLFANGFLNNPANEELRKLAREDKENGGNFEQEFYQSQLHLIYRLLFLMVIEERNLVYPQNEDQWKKILEKQYAHIPKLDLNKARKIYYDYYSVARLRKLAGKRHLADSKQSDYWIALKNTFRLFENKDYGMPLGIQPLSGDIFSYNAVGIINDCQLDNKVIIECLTKLSIFEHPDTHQKIRVNYGALNVEEFGSVYEGLLEYDPIISGVGIRTSDIEEGESENETDSENYGTYLFSFQQGSGRSSSGSHYTPDELVTPLIKHSLDYLLADRVKIIREQIKANNLTGSENRESRKILVQKHLYSLSVCDVACGSGHILLNAARRIAAEVANIIEEEEQPSPTAFRKAVRAVIQNCIYGVDLNPMAVELCKVALWLEAHNPGEPLNFLDHHIKCGNAIVGLAHQEELQNGIATEAFKSLPGDDKGIAAEFRNKNKREIKERTSGVRKFDFSDSINDNMDKALAELEKINRMPEHTIEEIEAKKSAYNQIGYLIRELRTIADIQVAQFFIPKTEENSQTLITDEKYFKFLRGSQPLQGPHIAKIATLALKKRFFHWFLEFPQIMANGGFDCILGNPPFLGNRKLKSTYGESFLEWVKYCYAPAGAIELVGYFFRRIFTLLHRGAFQSLIATNTVAQGDAREGGLAVIEKQGGTINFAIRSMKWPGLAAVEVALIAIHKGKWNASFVLDNKKVKNITSYLDDAEVLGEPYKLKQNEVKSFQGSIILGKGFILTFAKAHELIARNHKNKDVIFPYLNGDDLNNRIDQSPSRWVINFFDWDEEFCRTNYPEVFAIIEENVKPERTRWKKDKDGNDIEGTYALRKPLPEKWWIYSDKRPKLYRTIAPLDRVLGIARVAKYVFPVFISPETVYMDKVIVFPFNKSYVFSILHSDIYNHWTWKNSSTLGWGTLNHSPSACFETFSFPQNLSSDLEAKLEKIGEEDHESRKQLMLDIQLGLTKTYNQFHNCELRKFDENFESKGKMISVSGDNILIDGNTCKNKDLEKYIGKNTLILWNHLHKDDVANTIDFNEAVDHICELRKLHKQMDEAVLEAYGWNRTSPALSSIPDSPSAALLPPIDLAHDFYEVDYLPENDRIRYTISPEARKEVLKRLLLLNHKIYADEVAQGLHDKKKGKSTRKKKTAKSKTIKKLDAISDKEIKLPDEFRYSMNVNDYAAKLIMTMLDSTDASLDMFKLGDAFSLLCHPEIMLGIAPQNIRGIIKDWQDTNVQKAPTGLLMQSLKLCIQNGWIKIDSVDGRKYASINYDNIVKYPENAWIKTDAKLALAVANEISEKIISETNDLQETRTQIMNFAAA